MQDGQKAVWSIPYVSVAFFPSLKQTFIAYRSSSCPDCIFEIHQLWQSGFSRVHSNCCCSCWFEAEIIKIGQSSHKIYSNNILNFKESDNFKCLYEKSLGTYWRHHITRCTQEVPSTKHHDFRFDLAFEMLVSTVLGYFLILPSSYISEYIGLYSISLFCLVPSLINK